MTDVTSYNGGSDPYISYGEKVSTQQGQFLSFKNGEYLFGQDGATLALGTRLAANMEGLRIGWRRWWNKEVTDDMLELLSDQKPVPRRDSLGDNDPELWERGVDLKARDPWVFTNQLQFTDNEGNLYLYSTNSKGGLNAIGQLCKSYGVERRQHPGMVPVIELSNDYYMHKEYGKTYVPKFELVGWTDPENPDTSPQEALPPPGQRAANPTPAAKGAATNSTTKFPSSSKRF